MSYENYVAELKINNMESTAYHRKVFRKMICSKSTWYYLLQIWDGRYAALWYNGLDMMGPQIIAISEHYIKESGWPFALISDCFDEVREFINRGTLEMMEQGGISFENNKIKFIPKKINRGKDRNNLCIEKMKKDEQSFWMELKKIGLNRDEVLKAWEKTNTNAV